MGELTKKYRKNHIDYQKLMDVQLTDLNRLYVLELKKRSATKMGNQIAMLDYENYITVLKEAETELKNEG